MDEESTPPEEQPRYLLPDGCKDLIDTLRLEQQAIAPETASTEGPLGEPEASLPLPASISIPDPVIVRDLAAALHLQFYAVIRVLMEFDVFATRDTQIDFVTASALCSHYGVAAHKAV